MEKPREILSQFAQNTTAHGFSQLVKSKGKIQKVFWITLIIGCNVYILMNIKNLIQYYQKKSISTNIYFKNDASPVFPVVVLCNVNIINKDKIDKILIEIQKMNQNKERNITATINLQIIAELQLFKNDQIFDYGTQFDELFISCNLFKIRNCSNEKFWEKIWHPVYGTCFVFNEGFYQNGIKKDIEKVPNTGLIGSLDLVLNISQDLYYSDSGLNAGVQLYLGDQGSHYELPTKGYSLSPGFSHILSLSKKEIYRVDPFKNNSCVKHRRVKLHGQGQRIVTKYDPDLCTSYCLAKTLLKYCKCVRPEFIYVYPNITFCNDSSKVCERSILQKLFLGEIGCLKQCQPPCQEIKYLVDHKFLQFPNLVNKNKYGESLPNLRENLMRVQIFFNTFNVKVWEEKVLYKIENLLGDIGGQLGLFSGFSVITIFEFIFLMFVFAQYFSNRKNVRKSSDDLRIDKQDSP